MLAYGVDVATLDQIALSVGVRLNETEQRGKAVKFTLRPIGKVYRKQNPMNGRAVNAVCWHGHKRFFDALFRVAPEARVKTQCADDRGRDEYRARVEESDTPCGPEGNVWHRFSQSDCCECKQSEGADGLTVHEYVLRAA